MSYLQVRGYFTNVNGLFYATIPSLDLSKIHSSIDGALESILISLREYNITAHLTLIEGNGFTVESSEGHLEELVIQKRCS